MFIWPFCEKCCPQKSHWYGFSPKCYCNNSGSSRACARCSCARNAAHINHTDKASLPCVSSDECSCGPSPRNAARRNHIYTVYLQSGSSHACACGPSARNTARINHTDTASLQRESSHACACGPFARNAEHRGAVITFIRLLASVGPLMRAHVAILRETLPT